MSSHGPGGTENCEKKRLPRPRTDDGWDWFLFSIHLAVNCAPSYRTGKCSDVASARLQRWQSVISHGGERASWGFMAAVFRPRARSARLQRHCRDVRSGCGALAGSDDTRSYSIAAATGSVSSRWRQPSKRRRAPISSATNALDRVIEPDWIRPGTLVACVKAQELGREILTGADRIILHTRDLDPINYVAGYGPEPFRDTDFVDLLFSEKRGGGDVRDLLKTLATSAPDLADVLCGRIEARAEAGERVVFLNPVGTGLQFAAVARLILSAAERQGVGKQLPTSWFTEDMHP